MNNGRALKGHKRVQVRVGTPPATRRPPPGGYDVACACGWVGGNYPRSDVAGAAYREHIDYQIDHCLHRCKRCGVEKPLSDMRPDNRHLCRACSSALGDEWQRRHPAETARYKRNHQLLKRFGITAAEADELLARQGGVCAICGEAILDSRGYSPHVDHDHTTGRIRGILCLRCNSGLGAFKDDPTHLRSAIEYLTGEVLP